MAEAVDSGPVYHGPVGGGMIAVPLDMLTALYHRASGITHLVTSPVPEILDALADGPLTAPALVARLCARFEVDEAGAIDARLDELVQAGLISAA